MPKSQHSMDSITASSDTMEFEGWQMEQPPWTGSVNQRYESKSGSFYHQAKIVRKPQIPTVSWLICDFLSLKNDVNVHSYIGNTQKNLDPPIFVYLTLTLRRENDSFSAPARKLSSKMAPIERRRIPKRMPLYWKWMWSTRKRPPLQTSSKITTDSFKKSRKLQYFKMALSRKLLYFKIA